MTYNPNIPAAGTRIDQTYNLIQTNFNEANDIFGSTQGDHVSFNDVTAADRGKHNKSRYIEQGAAPVTATNECALYSREDTTTSKSELIYRKEGQAGAYANFTSDLPISLLLPRSFATYAGGASSAPLGYSFNADSMVRNSVGVYTITFTNSLSNTNYTVVVGQQNTLSGTTDNLVCNRLNTKSNTGFQVIFTARISGSNNLIDPTTFSYIVHGGF